MIVQPNNFNVADERPIEYGLWARNVPCFRCEWRDVLDNTNLDDRRTLLFHSSLSDTIFEVSVVYYRAGYEVREYDDYGERTRQQLEISTAIKCPDVLTHLTTIKSVQRALYGPGAIEHFKVDPCIRDTFMPMYRLDETDEGKILKSRMLQSDERQSVSSIPLMFAREDCSCSRLRCDLHQTCADVTFLNQGIAARKLALDHLKSKQHVLKPNLEGGGHNVYRDDIPAFASRLQADDWQSYTLMELIDSPDRAGVLLTMNGVYRGPVISEIGILGSCIWERQDSGVRFISNEVAGWTFKSKPANVDEMSVVKGYGCFDCPDLVEE